MFAMVCDKAPKRYSVSKDIVVKPICTCGGGPYHDMTITHALETDVMDVGKEVGRYYALLNALHTPLAMDTWFARNKPRKERRFDGKGQKVDKIKEWRIALMSIWKCILLITSILC